MNNQIRDALSEVFLLTKKKTPKYFAIKRINEPFRATVTLVQAYEIICNHVDKTKDDYSGIVGVMEKLWLEKSFNLYDGSIIYATNS